MPWNPKWMNRVPEFMRTFLLSLLIATICPTYHASASPRPKQAAGLYLLDILGFNDGDPYRITGAEAEAVLTEAGSVIFRFQSSDWMGKKASGTYVKASQLAQRFANRSIADLVEVYRLDLEHDEEPEFLLVPSNKKIGHKRRYAPTIIKRSATGFEPMWVCKELPGERFKVLDLRDLNGDGTPEILLSGEAGRRGYYQFHRLIGFGKSGFSALAVKHVDSVHYVDLTADGLAEIVVRTRVGRRGPASQWTYIDQLYSWNGDQFEDASTRYPRYHDEETLPTLIDDLIDHYDAELTIRFEKVEAIERVRASTLQNIRKPRGFRRKMVKALKALQKNRTTRAKRLLMSLQQNYPYEPQVLMGLARVDSKDKRWDSVLDSAIRALTVAPRLREAWWQAAIAFTHLRERSSAVASLHNAVQLCGKLHEGISFLKARQGEKGLVPDLKDAIAGTLRRLGKTGR
jgi:hypothetical protein